MIHRHYHRPDERPFTADERDRTTILFGGITPAHERLIEAVFHACGYRCRRLPTPDLASFHLGREYCNTGQCNPTYFTIGCLLGMLLELEAEGYSRQHIIDQFVFFTAGSCGPCRFGMYESEYRLALHNAGFVRFRRCRRRVHAHAARALTDNSPPSLCLRACSSAALRISVPAQSGLS
jgi:hypothetical protein